MKLLGTAALAIGLGALGPGIELVLLGKAI